LPVGGSVTTFEIERIGSGGHAFYTLAGFDCAFGLKAAMQGPSDWTTFYSDRSINDFHGYVVVKAASLTLGIGCGGMDLTFVTGPAAGLKINGLGWSTGMNLGVGATHGMMIFRNWAP
jgi:hypothetical protein